MNFFKEQPDFTGDKTHLEILIRAIKKKDISIWNRWRQDNKNKVPNLQRVYLNGECFNSKCLKGADFSNANLKEAIFHGSDLIRVSFKRADLSFVDFSNASLYKTDCQGANISNVNFICAKIKETDMRGVSLYHSIIMGAHVSKTDISQANVYKTQFLHNTLINLKCSFLYIDKYGKKRFPKNRKFRMGEFEEIAARYKRITSRITNLK